MGLSSLSLRTRSYVHASMHPHRAAQSRASDAIFHAYSHTPIHSQNRVTDLVQCPDTGRITGVKCGTDEVFEADAVISAVGINGAKSIVRASPTLNRRKMFQDMMNLRYV